MVLSNTATPKYYGQFRDAVLNGEIPVCEEIEQEMNRIDSLIVDPGFYYDPDPVEGFIRFCENEMTLTDGSDLKLLDTFKLWAEQVLCWYYFVERSVYEPSPDGIGGKFVNKRVIQRLVKKQYLIVSRGSSKSLYASLFQSYYLNIDTSTTQQIVVAPTMKQADETIQPIKTAIARNKGPLFKFLTEGSLQNTTGSRAQRQKLASTKKGVENFLTNSIVEIRPMSIDKVQGLRAKCSTVDEWLSGDIREDVIGPIEQGAAKNDDYLIIATTSEGVVRNGPGDTIKMELKSILRGEYYAPHISIFHYKLDDVKEVAKPEMWRKAAPNLGITVKYETYHQDVERMEKVPATRNDILAKRFGIPMEGFTYFFAYEETIPHRRRDFWNMPCSLGADLSQGDDFCAFTFMFPLGDDTFGIKSRSYITDRTMTKLPAAARYKYDQFLEEGSLVVMDGSILDIDGEVYEDLMDHIDNSRYDVRTFGYDPYGAKEFVTKYEAENGSFGVEKVIQGARTESIPLGELKKLAEDRKLLFDELIMSFAMGNTITLEDTNANRKLWKLRQSQKIDPVSAMMDSYVAYKRNTDAFE